MSGPWRPLAVAALLLAAAGPGRAPGLDAAATVNGAVIPRQRLDRYVEAYARERGRSVANVRSPAAYHALLREALDVLVDDELLVQEAERRGLAAPRAEVDAAVAGVRRRFEVPGAFEARLAAEGLSEADLADQARRQLTIGRLVQATLSPGAEVGDEEVHAFYVANQARFARAPGGGAPEVAPEAEVRERIREQLRSERLAAAVRERVAALRQGADIRLLLP